MTASPGNDIVFLGHRIHPLGGAAPVTALLVRDGHVVACGTESRVRAAAGPGARIEELQGFVTPGFTDAHVHLTAWALARRAVDLHGVRSVDEVVARVRRAAAARGQGWILGQGWNRHLLDREPTREALDEAAPGSPVFLESNDIHAAWLSTRALELCGISGSTSDPPGGAIARGAGGEPTGILLEEARALALTRVPPPDPDELVGALSDAVGELHRLGITGVHSVEPTGLADLRRLHAERGLRLRVLQHIGLAGLDEAIAAGLRSGSSPAELGGRVRIGGVKMFLDGTLGSCTALLRAPYEGSEAYRGMATLEEREFRDAVGRAAESGLATTVHAIGDAAVELALEVLQEVPPPSAIPHRIEHVQLCPPELWDRAGRSGIVASMQPVHLLTDIPAAERHWGHARSRGAYAFAPLLRAGMTLAFGSDVPVETPDPRPGLFAAVRRVSRSGEWKGREWYPENGLRIGEALAAYTEGAAVAAGAAETLGRLLPGYLADLTVWDRDPLECGPEELLEIRCVATVVAGEVVFREGDATRAPEPAPVLHAGPHPAAAPHPIPKKQPGPPNR